MCQKKSENKTATTCVMGHAQLKKLDGQINKYNSGHWPMVGTFPFLAFGPLTLLILRINLLTLSNVHLDPHLSTNFISVDQFSKELLSNNFLFSCWVKSDQQIGELIEKGRKHGILFLQDIGLGLFHASSSSSGFSNKLWNLLHRCLGHLNNNHLISSVKLECLKFSASNDKIMLCYSMHSKCIYCLRHSIFSYWWITGCYNFCHGSHKMSRGPHAFLFFEWNLKNCLYFKKFITLYKLNLVNPSRLSVLIQGEYISMDLPSLVIKKRDCSSKILSTYRITKWHLWQEKSAYNWKVWALLKSLVPCRLHLLVWSCSCMH